ncbi:MAG: hypothetical protein IMY72_03275 [Bacteroidetes bacterium]|nr:hypothetical protein [Bacteroidota bacterium]
MKHFLIGIDDTDNQDSRGTGYHSRCLGKLIEEKKVGMVEGITRHQLLFDPRIPYTSHNSSACLEVMSDNFLALTELCRDFLLRESADGSDAGLAVAEYNKIEGEVLSWGLRAKKDILTQPEARDIAKKNNILLEGLTGDKDGIIGSLAAIALRKSGNDGRFIWIKGTELRQLKGVYKIEQLFKEINFDAVVDRNLKIVSNIETIDAGEWLRPILKNNKKIIIADKSLNDRNYEWKVTSKDYIKKISD